MNSQGLSSAEKFNGTSKSFYPESNASHRYDYNPYGIQNNMNSTGQSMAYSTNTQYYPQNNLAAQYNNFMPQPQVYAQMPMYYPGQLPPQMMPGNPYAMNQGYFMPDNTIQANYVATQPIIINNNLVAPEKSINIENNYNQNSFGKQYQQPSTTSTKQSQDHGSQEIKNYIKEQEEFLQKLENDRKKLKDKVNVAQSDQYSYSQQDQYHQPERYDRSISSSKAYPESSSSKKKNRLINFDDEVEEAEMEKSHSPYQNKNELEEISNLKKKTDDFFEKFLNPKDHKSHKSPKKVYREQPHEEAYEAPKQYNRGRQYREETSPDQDRFAQTNKTNGSSPSEELDYSISDKGERVRGFLRV